MGKRSLKSLLLALALVSGMVLPARAAGLRLVWTRQGNNGAVLTLRGLGEESIYGLQLELTVEGDRPNAAFTPAAGESYSECRVSASEQGTRIVVYLTAQKPLNSGSALEVGTLSLKKSLVMPESVTVKLLGHELKPLSGAEEAVISAQEQSAASSGGEDDGDDDEPETYRVRVSSARHGEVKANRTWAEARELVTLTVTPEEGYGLNALTVTSARGREMSLTDAGGGKYTFTMPTASVEVTAAFLPAGQNHPVMAFTDVAEWDWFHSAVHYVYENSMMTGTSETTFSPGMETSRGMIVTVLHRLEGSPEAVESHFSDVSREEYYAKAVDWAYANGVVSGHGGNEAGTFGPQGSLTREQLAAILYRYAGLKGLDLSARGDLSVFADEGSISDYARESMAWAVGTGLISGMGDGTISPAGTASRAQVATILMRYCQNLMD